MPPSDDVVAYLVEYWDEQATLTRQFRLNSFKDGASCAAPCDSWDATDS
jgi:hypothetical protein